MDQLHASGAESAALAAPVSELMAMVTGYRVSQVVYVAAKLGIADLVGDRSMTAAELAVACGTDRTALGRLLRALAGRGILACDAQSRYSLTALGSCLRSDHAGGVRARAIMNGEEQYQAWAELQHTVRTGKPAFDHVFGESFWEWMDHSSSMATAFGLGMAGTTAERHTLIDETHDFGGVHRVVDVGGGYGGLLIALLRSHPDLYGTLLDMPAVAAQAREALRAEGLESRCTVVDGDFRECVPGGGDVYILSRILPDWEDDDAEVILSHCRRAMHAKARLLIVARLIPEDASPSINSIVDLHLMVLMGGKERSEREYRDLLARAGLVIERIAATRNPDVSIIEARRA